MAENATTAETAVKSHRGVRRTATGTVQSQCDRQTKFVHVDLEPMAIEKHSKPGGCEIEIEHD